MAFSVLRRRRAADALLVGLQILVLAPLFLETFAAVQPEVCGITSTMQRSEPSCQGQLSGWIPAAVYHSSMKEYLRFPAIGFPGLTTGTRDLTAFVIGVGKYTSDMFETVVPANFHQWNNTRQGEWEAKVNSRYTVSLGVTNGECILSGVSLFRPTEDNLALRLSYDHCMGVDFSVKHVAIVLQVSRAPDNGFSGLYHFMCRLMPPEVCDALPLGDKGQVDIDFFAQYRPMGMGGCKHTGGRSIISTAATLNQCAKECAIRNSAAIRRDGGSNCTGFQYGESHDDEGIRRTLFLDNEVTERSDEVSLDATVKCYRMVAVMGQSEAEQPETADKQRPAEILNLIGDLGFRPLAAVRERFAPQSPGCYEPFDWIRVIAPTDPYPEWETKASRRAQQRRLASWDGRQRHPSMIPLSETVFDRVLASLPIVDPIPLDIDSVVYADQVCVAALRNGACMYDETGDEVDLSSNFFASDTWKIAVTAVLSSVLTMLTTLFFVTHYSPSSPPLGYQPVVVDNFGHVVHAGAISYLAQTELTPAQRVGGCRPWLWFYCLVFVAATVISVSVIVVSSGKNMSCPDVEV